MVSNLVSICFGNSQLGHLTKTNFTTCQTVDPELCWDKFVQHILHMIFHEKYFSCYILITDQISLSDCLYFLRYLGICVLLLYLFVIYFVFIIYVITFLSSRFVTWPKIINKNRNISRAKRAFKVKQKAFFIFKALSVARNCLRPESALLT